MSDPDLGPLLRRVADALDRLAPAVPQTAGPDSADAFVWHAEQARLQAVDVVNCIDLALLKGIERELGLERARRPPADDRARIDVDDEGDVDEARPAGHVGEVGYPEPVGGGCVEVPLHEVRRSGRALVRHGRPFDLATYHPRETQLPHQPLHRAARDGDALAVQLAPELARTVDPKLLGVDVPQLHLQRLVAHPPRRERSAAGGVVAGRGDLQFPADRLDPEAFAVGLDEASHFGSRGSSSRAKKAAVDSTGQCNTIAIRGGVAWRNWVGRGCRMSYGRGSGSCGRQASHSARSHGRSDIRPARSSRSSSRPAAMCRRRGDAAPGH